MKGENGTVSRTPLFYLNIKGTSFFGKCFDQDVEEIKLPG